MNDPINFDIDGLVARYQLHPERQDVFVEGERDQGLMRAFLENRKHIGVCVFSIAVVNITPHSVLQRHLPHPSRRSEVITLAMELERRQVSPRQATCIADADFEYLLPQKLACNLLLLTDYASMELYSFSHEVLQTVLLTVAPGTSYSGAAFIRDLAGPLQFLFAARAVNFDLQFGLPWINNFEKFFALHGKRIEFDDAEFLKRYAIDRLPSQQADRFKTRLGEIQTLLCSDVRCRMRGHDFVKILTWYLRAVEKCKHLNEDSVRQLLYVTIRSEQLASEPLFRSLQERLGLR